jgi:hypothetical protein
MNHLSRRAFVEMATASVVGLGGVATANGAQLVYKPVDWKIADFERLVKANARVKQIFDIVQIREGKFLNNIKNSLNGLHFGFGIPENQIKVIAALHGPANLLNFDDYAWQKYRIGEWLDVKDPETGQPAVRNPFVRSKVSQEAKRNDDPNDENSMLQDSSIQTLQSRDVQFLCCHTATEEQSRVLIRERGLEAQPEEVVKDLLAHALPGVLVVASMVAAVALLQSDGHFSYITV